MLFILLPQDFRDLEAFLNSVGLVGPPSQSLSMMIWGVVLLIGLLVIRSDQKVRLKEKLAREAKLAAEEAAKAEVASKTKAKLLSDQKVVKFEGRNYFPCSNGYYAYRLKERSQQDREDDVWHFVAAIVLIDWIADSVLEDDDAEASLADIASFEAAFLDAVGLDIMPSDPLETIHFEEMDTSEYTAEILEEDFAAEETLVDDFAEDAFDGHSDAEIFGDDEANDLFLDDTAEDFVTDDDGDDDYDPFF
jgi:hypothetical protein